MNIINLVGRNIKNRRVMRKRIRMIIRYSRHKIDARIKSMKACMGGMLVGLAVGVTVASVYPMPMKRCTVRKIKRQVRRALHNAQDMM